MALFLSTYINKVDAKGRVSVPAPFRVALAREGVSSLVLFKSYRIQAIEGCTLERMTRLSESVDQLDLFSDAQDDLSATLFAEALHLNCDADGRILMPESMRAFAGITQQAAFVGRGATFQIWEPKILESHQQAARERLRQSGATLKLQTS